MARSGHQLPQTSMLKTWREVGFGFRVQGLALGFRVSSREVAIITVSAAHIRVTLRVYVEVRVIYPLGFLVTITVYPAQKPVSNDFGPHIQGREAGI